MSFLQTLTDVPICVGFGIKDAKSAAAVSAHADGVVVGSALVQLMADSADPNIAAERLHSAAADIRHGLDG
jgi:tryptophan synthase alpha chain